MADQCSLLFLSKLYHLDNNRDGCVLHWSAARFFYFYEHILSVHFSFVFLSVPAPVGEPTVTSRMEKQLGRGGVSN